MQASSCRHREDDRIASQENGGMLDFLPGLLCLATAGLHEAPLDSEENRPWLRKNAQRSKTKTYPLLYLLLLTCQQSCTLQANEGVAVCSRVIR